MCEITTKWGPSEWSGIIQAVGAIIASIFLFLTFRSQKRSEKLMKESAEIDKRAKRGEYLPEIKLEILTFYPTISDGFGGAKIRKYNGEITTIEIKIIFNKNSVQILDFEFLQLEKYIQYEIYPFPLDRNKILLSGEAFELKFSINLQNYFDLVNDQDLDDFNSIIESNFIDYESRIYLKNKLFFADMLGNKYEFRFNVSDLKTLYYSELIMVD